MHFISGQEGGKFVRRFPGFARSSFSQGYNESEDFRVVRRRRSRQTVGFWVFSQTFGEVNTMKV
jgi:hypothetical protein